MIIGGNLSRKRRETVDICESLEKEILGFEFPRDKSILTNPVYECGWVKVRHRQDQQLAALKGTGDLAEGYIGPSTDSRHSRREGQQGINDNRQNVRILLMSKQRIEAGVPDNRITETSEDNPFEEADEDLIGDGQEQLVPFHAGRKRASLAVETNHGEAHVENNKEAQRGDLMLQFPVLTPAPASSVQHAPRLPFLLTDREKQLLSFHFAPQTAAPVISTPRIVLNNGLAPTVPQTAGAQSTLGSIPRISYFSPDSTGATELVSRSNTSAENVGLTMTGALSPPAVSFAEQTEEICINSDSNETIVVDKTRQRGSSLKTVFTNVVDRSNQRSVSDNSIVKATQEKLVQKSEENKVGRVRSNTTQSLRKLRELKASGFLKAREVFSKIDRDSGVGNSTQTLDLPSGRIAIARGTPPKARRFSLSKGIKKMRRDSNAAGVNTDDADNIFKKRNGRRYSESDAASDLKKRLKDTAPLTPTKSAPEKNHSFKITTNMGGKGKGIFKKASIANLRSISRSVDNLRAAAKRPVKQQPTRRFSIDGASPPPRPTRLRDTSYVQEPEIREESDGFSINIEAAGQTFSIPIQFVDFGGVSIADIIEVLRPELYDLYDTLTGLTGTGSANFLVAINAFKEQTQKTINDLQSLCAQGKVTNRTGLLKHIRSMAVNISKNVMKSVTQTSFLDTPTDYYNEPEKIMIKRLVGEEEDKGEDHPSKCYYSEYMQVAKKGESGVCPLCGSFHKDACKDDNAEAVAKDTKNYELNKAIDRLDEKERMWSQKLAGDNVPYLRWLRQQGVAAARTNRGIQHVEEGENEGIALSGNYFGEPSSPPDKYSTATRTTDGNGRGGSIHPRYFHKRQFITPTAEFPLGGWVDVWDQRSRSARPQNWGSGPKIIRGFNIPMTSDATGEGAQGDCSTASPLNAQNSVNERNDITHRFAPLTEDVFTIFDGQRPGYYPSTF